MMISLASVTTVFVVTTTVIWFLRRLRIRKRNEDLYVLITGCDTGFGRQAALKFDERGINVFAGCLTQEAMKELKNDCSEHLYPILMDVTKEKHVVDAVKVVNSRIPHDKCFWAVINNAGVAWNSGMCETLVVQDYIEVMNVNLFGMMSVNKHFLPLLRKSSGRIVNVLSVAGKFEFVFTSPYVVSKFAAEGYSGCLRRELLLQGVSVHAIEPGVFDTGVIERANIPVAAQRAFDRLSREAKSYYGENYPQRLYGNFTSYRGSKAIYKVVDAYYDAVTARFPRPYYRVGIDAKTICALLIILPCWITDTIMTFTLPRPAGTKKM